MGKWNKNLDSLTDLLRCICRCKQIQRLSFRALAFRQSQSRNCGSYEVYILFGAAALLKKKRENGNVKNKKKFVEWKAFVDSVGNNSVCLKHQFFASNFYGFPCCPDQGKGRTSSCIGSSERKKSLPHRLEWVHHTWLRWRYKFKFRHKKVYV